MTNPIPFYNEMTGSVDEGKAVDVIYLDFSEAFDIVSHNILVKKLLKYGLDKQTVRWIENWLNGCAQSVIISGTKSRWRPVTRGIDKVTSRSPFQPQLFCGLIV